MLPKAMAKASSFSSNSTPDQELPYPAGVALEKKRKEKKKKKDYRCSGSRCYGGTGSILGPEQLVKGSSIAVVAVSAVAQIQSLALAQKLLYATVAGKKKKGQDRTRAAAKDNVRSLIPYTTEGTTHAFLLFLFFLAFSRAVPATHREVPRLGVESEQ